MQSTVSTPQATSTNGLLDNRWSIIQTITSHLHQATNLARIQQEVVTALTQTLDYQAAQLYQLNATGQVMPWSEPSGSDVLPETKHLLQQAVQQHQPATQQHSNGKQEEEMALPLLHGQRPVGILWVQQRPEQPFTETDQQFLQTIASLLATHLHGLRPPLNPPSRRQTSPLPVLSPSEGLQGYLYDPEDDDYEPYETAQSSPTLAQWAIRNTPQEVVYHRTDEGEGVVVPIKVKGETIGLVGLDGLSQAGHLSEDDKLLLEEVSDQAAQAIENARLLAQTQERTAETEQLFEISRQLVEANSLDEVYDIVIDTIKAQGVDRVSISLLDRTASGEIETVWIAATWDRDPTKQSAVGTRFSAKNFALVHTFAQPPYHPLISEDLTNLQQPDERLDEPFRQFVRDQLGMYTMFSAPMFLGQTYKGVLSIYTRQPHEYSQREVRLYQMLADQAIIVVENHTLLEATRQERDRAAMLSELGQSLNRVTTLDAVQKTTLMAIPRCGVPHGELLLRFNSIDDSEDDWQSSLASTITRRQSLSTRRQQEITEQLSRTLQPENGSELVIKTKDDSDWPRHHYPEAHSLAWAPLVANRSHLTGALIFISDDPTPFTQNQLTTFRAVANQVAGTLEKVWLLEETAAALRQTEQLYQATRTFNAAQTPADLLTTLAQYIPTEVDYVALSQFERIEPYRRGRLLSPLELTVEWQAAAAEDETSQVGQARPGKANLYPTTPSLTNEKHPFVAKLTPHQPIPFTAADLPTSTDEPLFAGRQSLLALPLRVGSAWLGVLWLGSSPAEVTLSPNEVQQLTALAGQVAVVMQNLSLNATTQLNLYRTELLSQLSESLLGADNTQAVYQACLQAIAQTKPSRGAFVFMFDSHEQSNPEASVTLTALWDTDAEGTTTDSWPLLQPGTEFAANDLGIGRLVWTGNPIIIESVAADDRLSTTPKETLHLMQISGLVAVPLWLRRQVDGFLLIAAADDEPAEADKSVDSRMQSVADLQNSMFSEARVQLYQDIARRTSDALEYQRVLDEASYRATLLQTTAKISETATASLDLTTLLPQTVDLIRDRLGFYHVAIYLVDSYQKYAAIQAATGSIGQKMVQLRHKLAVGGKSIVGTVTGTGKAHIELDVRQAKGHFNNPLLPETRSEMALPLIARSKVIGALDVHSQQVAAFTESDIAILQSMANQLANAIEAAQAFQEAQQALAETNRLHDFYLREEWRGFLQEEHQGQLGILYDYGLWKHEVSSLTDEIKQVAENGQSLILRGDEMMTSAELSDDLESTDEAEIDKLTESGETLPHAIVPLRLHGQTTIGTLDMELPFIDDSWEEENLRIIEAVATQAAQAVETARLFEQTQSAREEAEALYKVVRTLVTVDDEQVMYHTVMTEMLSALGLSQGGIMLLEPGTHEQDESEGAQQTLLTTSNPQYISRSVVLFVDGKPVERQAQPSRNYHLLFEELVQHKKPILIEDVMQDARLSPLHERLAPYGVVSMLVIPIVIEDKVRGAVRAEVLSKTRTFSEREVNLASAMIDQLSITLQTYRLLEETNRRAVQLQTSADVSQVATSILDQDRMLTEAVNLIQERFGYYHVQVFMADELRQYAVLHHATGEIGQRLLELDHKVAIGSPTVIGEVAETGQSVVVRDIKVREADSEQDDLSKWGISVTVDEAAEEPDATAAEIVNAQPDVPTNGAAQPSQPQREPTALRERTTSSYRISGSRRHEFLPDTQAELAVPLQVGETILGVLDVQSIHPDAFSREEISTLETLASQLAIAIQNARQFKEQQETAARLREVDKLKTQFLANMSHELRTPLNSIIGFSRVILKGIDGPLTELQKADLTSIHNSGQHLLGLINNLLDLSKIEAGKMELNFEEVEIEPIIKQVVSTALALVKDKPVKLVTKVDDGIPTVWADVTRIRQVTLNLVSNACKFTEEGEIVIRGFANKDKVTVSVTDSGIGIPQEKLSSIFEEFTQVDASTTRKVGGTGLGLPISRHFIEMHKGQIWVESEPGVGSTFSFAIPIKPVEAEEGEPEETGDKSEPTKSENLTKKIIIAIDSDPNVVALYKRFLAKEYEVIGINDTENIVAKVKHYAPSAILLDVLIPGTDGWSVLADLQENTVTQAIPIIICSTVKDKNRAYNLGVADYLVKPIVENELVRALRNVESMEREKTRVLIIDDHVDDVLLIRRMLEAQENFKVIEANNGREGLKLVESMQPDLIICDLNMPEMNGFRVVESLKSNSKMAHIPIIIVSAQELSVAENKFLNNHVELLLKKGIFTEQELLDDIGQILDQIRQKR